MRFAFTTHAFRPDAGELAKKCGAWLASLGHEAVLWDDLEDQQVPGADLAVSLGGDGTMLRTVELAMPSDTPVLGVNLGTLGYLTEIMPEDLHSGIQRFMEGSFQLERRLALEAILRPAGGDPVVLSSSVLNDVVMERCSAGHTVRVETSIGGEAFTTFVGDGMIVATPTGSTAYSFSAGGPIVSPAIDVLLVTPISPHMLLDRSLVLPPEEELILRLVERRQAAVVLDGRQVATANPGDSVVVRASQKKATLVRFGKGSHFRSVIRAKFHLAEN